MKVNNYPLKTPSTGDKLFGSDVNGDQKQFDMSAVSNNVFQYEIGQYVEDEGGVIFHRYLDGDTQKYLAVEPINVTGTLIGSTAQSTWDGLSNSNAIISQATHTSSAAKLCLDSTINNQTDWYLLSIDELLLLYNNKFNVNKTLSSVPGASEIDILDTWCSTEFNTTQAFYKSNSAQTSSSKSNTFRVRAIRKFSI